MIKKLLPLLLLILIGCSQPEPLNNRLLEKRDGVQYQTDTNEILSGTYISLYDIDLKISYVLNEDNTGVLTYIYPDFDRRPYDMTWEVKINESKSTDWSFTGLLIVRPDKKYSDIEPIIQWNFVFQNVEKHPDKDTLQGYYKSDFNNYNGGNILTTWVIGSNLFGENSNTTILEGF